MRDEPGACIGCPVWSRRARCQASGVGALGVGIAYLPDFSIRGPLADGRLLPVLSDYVERSGVFHVLWPASRHPWPKLRALVDFRCANVFPAAPAETPRGRGCAAS